MAIEAVVAKVNDLAEGEMKEVTVGETTVLLTRMFGEFLAVGGICTHYGGHLAEGAVCGERVYCPWHQSVFNTISGDLEEPPGFDAVPRYDVRLEGENVIVRVPEEAPERRTLPMVKYDPQMDSRTFVIVGGGGAGLAAAETLRQEGFQGRIVMISRDTAPPYDRPEVSKGYMKGDSTKESMPLRTPQFYADHDIEVLLQKEVTQVDARTRGIKFKDGSSLKYDSLLLATGGVARRLEVPGGELANIFTLRSMEDTDRILAAAEGKGVLCVGASFISMEVAQSLTKRGGKVTVVAPGAVPFEKTLGPEIGRMWQQLHEAKGVSFKTQAKVTAFEGDRQVRGAVLANGERIEADLVVVGMGIKPATEFLKGVELGPDGSVKVDPYMRVRDELYTAGNLSVHEGLYAAGDIARFPDWRTGELIRIEHWRLALQHGRIAGHNMAHEKVGKKLAYTGVPFFWTDQFDVMMQYVGYVSGWDEIIYQGKMAEKNFLAFYVKNHRVLAVAACGHEQEMAAIAELMRLRKMPGPEEMRRGPVDFLKLLRS